MAGTSPAMTGSLAGAPPRSRARLLLVLGAELSSGTSCGFWRSTPARTTHRPPSSTTIGSPPPPPGDGGPPPKGGGGGVRWLAFDGVLRIAGGPRRDVDAIASTRAFYPAAYL